MPPRRSIFLLALCAALVVAGFASVVLYRAERDHREEQVRRELTGFAQFKARQVADWRDERLGEGLELASREPVRRAIFAFLADGDVQAREALREEFARIQRFDGYADITLLTPDGTLRFALGGDEPEAASCLCVEPELLRGAATAPLLSELHLHAEEGHAHIGTVIPFADPSAPATPRAFVILDNEVSHTLLGLVQMWPVNSATSETTLIRRDGDDALFLAETRRHPGSTLTLRVPLSQTDSPAAAAARGARGIVRGRDYRGEEVLAAIEPIPGSTWAVVSQIDVAEALELSRLRLGLGVSLLVAASALLGGLLVVSAQRSAKQRFRALYEAEAARREQFESEARLSRIAASVPGVIFTIEPLPEGGLRMPFASDALADVFGVSPADVAADSSPLCDRIHPDDAPRVNEAIETSVRTMAPLQVEWRYDHPTRGERWFEVQALPHGTPGQVVLHGFVMDVTERKRSERAEAGLAAFRRAMMEQSVDGIAVFSPDHRVIDANPRFAEMLGYPLDEVYGLHTWDFEANIDEAAIRAAFSDFAQVRRTFETRHRRKDGSLYDAEVSASGAVIGGESVVFTISRDISERKRMEAQLAQAQKMESIGTLAGGVAHDFNNMLSVILGHAALALEDVDPGSSLHADLTEIQAAAHRSADLTRQLLTFARRQPVQPRFLDLNETVATSAKMLRRLIGEDIDLTLVEGHALWPVRIDPAQVAQLLANLCVNARDAIGGVGRIAIATDNVTLDAEFCVAHAGAIPGDYVMLSVTDDGCGMDASVRAHLFEPFFTTKEVGRGTGLGLSTVYGIVRQNDGLIAVDSAPGRGSCFRVYLPRSVDRPRESRDRAAAPPVQGRGETILLVEDEPSILRMDAVVLERLGYRVLAASSPGEALETSRVTAGPIDLLITDVVMPGMNGRELAEKIAAERPGLRTLFVSGYPSEVIAHRGVLDDGVLFLQKPFAPQDLAAKVRESIEQAV